MSHQLLLQVMTPPGTDVSRDVVMATGTPKHNETCNILYSSSVFLHQFPAFEMVT